MSINDQPVDEKFAKEIAAMIASAPQKVKIKVIAEGTKPDHEFQPMPAPKVMTAAAYKPTPDSKVGIGSIANRISYINNGQQSFRFIRSMSWTGSCVNQ